MKFQYDEAADALYIEISDRPVCRTEQIEAGTLVDLDEQGSIIGIEVLRPAREWPLEEILARFQFASEARAILHELWGSGRLDRRFPFARPVAVG